jgi:hypothetical protein
MATMTTSYDARTAVRRTTMLRRMLAGAATFDLAGGIFCFAAATDLGGWLSIPRGFVEATGALFLAASVAGFVTLRREPLRVGAIVAANELFALWCVLMLATSGPNALGIVLLAVATASSAGTGIGELLLARQREGGRVPLG